MRANLNHNPYLGIYSYTAADANIFYGRDREIKALTNVILKNVSTIMTGYSGCGKTSLLQAGILPKLSLCNYHLIRITPKDVYVKPIKDLFVHKSFGADRVNETNKEFFYAFEFWCEINRLIQKSVKDNGLICTINGDSVEETTLFEKMFHVVFRDNFGNRHFFAVVIDQFEEIFQFGLNVKNIERVFELYEILCGNYLPSYEKVFELSKCMYKDENGKDVEYEYKDIIFPNKEKYNRNKLPLLNRFIISIRKDYLFDLQSYSNYYPILYQNVNYVEHLDDDHAAIVIRSGCEEFKELDTKAIISCIIEKYDFEDNDGEVDYRVDTLTLSVVMYEIWEKYSNNKNGYESVANITCNFKEKFEIILNDFYKDRIKSMMIGSDKGKKKKIDYLNNILNNNVNLKKLQENQTKIVDKFINNGDGKVYSEEEIGKYIDAKFYGEKFGEDYVKKCCSYDTLRKKYYFKSETVLGRLLGQIEDDVDLNMYLDVVISGKSFLDINFALLSISELAYGIGRNNAYNEVNIRKEIINTLKKFSLIDSIRRCGNKVVKDKLEQHLNQIIFELQEKLLSDSGYRQSVYIDDICKLFDKYVYGDIDSKNKRGWLCDIIKNYCLDVENGLLDLCVNQYSTNRDRICYLIENNYVHISDYSDELDLFEGNCYTFKSKDDSLFFQTYNGRSLLNEIDKHILVNIVTPYLINKEFREDKNGFYFPAKPEINEKLIGVKNYNCLLPEGDKFYFFFNKSSLCNLIRRSDNIDDKFLMELFNINRQTICNLISDNEFTMTLLEEDEEAFRKKLNKCIYHINNEIDKKSDVRTEIADVIKNCKLFVELNKGNKENMLEFRHDRLCKMAKEHLAIHRIRRNNTKRFTPDIYFTPQGRLKENNCFVEWFLGPWNTYSTVMSSMYFMSGDMGNIVDFDTDCITQLRKINYDNASSAIVTIALNERFGDDKYEYYHDLPAYFTHFRVKVEDNKIYNISFETREKNDSNVKKVVISTGFHKVRFYYDKYDRIVLKEFCVRRDGHEDFYVDSLTKELREEHKSEDEIKEIINHLPCDVRVTLPEVGYNAIYYKYDRIYYRCPSETYFLNIKLSQIKDLREYAKEGNMSELYSELDANIKCFNRLKSGQIQNQELKYVVKHIVDGNYGYKSLYDNYGCEKYRIYFGGTKYGFDSIKFEYDKIDNLSGNIKSIAFFKNSVAETYHYPFKTKEDDSNIHKIELIPIVFDYGICKMTKYCDKNNNECYDKSKDPITGKKYTYTYEVQNNNQNDSKCSFIKTLTAEYCWKDGDNVDCEVRDQRVQKMIVRQFEDTSSAVLSIESYNSNGEKINGRKIVKGANIFNYESQKNESQKNKDNIVDYHRIEFKYTRGMVKTHIFTKEDCDQYKYLINRSGDVCVRKPLKKQPWTITIGNVSFIMILVEGGVFDMGHEYDENDYKYREAGPVHKVRVDDFYIGQTTVTIELWNSVMHNKKISKRIKDLPVVNVTWNEVCEFIERLNARVECKKLKFRLPTEAEWEYAARGGRESKKYMYSGSNTLKKVAVTTTNARCVSPGKKEDGSDARKANELGIYDMSGNVKEWCYDYFWLYPKSFGKTIDNPVGPSTGYARVVRGGGFRSKNYTCRVYNRDCSFPDVKKDDIGFRLVLDVDN